MKRMLLFACIFCVTNCFSQARDSVFTPRTRNEKELFRLTLLMSSASETGDSTVYARTMDDGFLITYSSCQSDGYGKFANKAQVISRWMRPSPGGSTGSSRPRIYRMQIDGKTGVVHSLIADEFLDADGKKQTANSWATDIWVKRKGRWYWLSSHESLLNN